MPNINIMIPHTAGKSITVSRLKKLSYTMQETNRRGAEVLHEEWLGYCGEFDLLVDNNLITAKVTVASRSSLEKRCCC